MQNRPNKQGNPGNQPREQADNWLDRKERRESYRFGRHPTPKERRREEVIRDWLGPEEARNFILNHQRQAEHIGEVLGDVLSSIGMRRQALLEKLMDKWPELVGDDIAKKSMPCRLMAQRLDVEVENPSWLYILRTTHAASILARVQKFSEGAISEIRFVPAGRHARGRRR
mgnify:CR=1 FL=1